MKSNDLQGHLESYIYWVNWDRTAPKAYFSLPLSPQVYRAIALLFKNKGKASLLSEVKFKNSPIYPVSYYKSLIQDDLNHEWFSIS